MNDLELREVPRKRTITATPAAELWYDVQD